VSDPRDRSCARLALARLWTGPLAHLLGGALDVGEALARHLCARAFARARGRIARGEPAARVRALLRR
jgi:hypothetical protein